MRCPEEQNPPCAASRRDAVVPGTAMAWPKADGDIRMAVGVLDVEAARRLGDTVLQLAPGTRAQAAAGSTEGAWRRRCGAAHNGSRSERRAR